jgi:hypothetical protein
MLRVGKSKLSEEVACEGGVVFWLVSFSWSVSFVLWT